MWIGRALPVHDLFYFYNKEGINVKSSGIGGQAVIEGVMMRNKDKYAVAVRKPDNNIEVSVKNCTNLAGKYRFLKLPIIRGIFSFIDSLVVGMSTLSYSASFYEDDEPDAKERAYSDTLTNRLKRLQYSEVCREGYDDIHNHFVDCDGSCNFYDCTLLCIKTLCCVYKE